MVNVAPAQTASDSDYDPEKLEAAILFFLERANNGHLGKTKLMKLLYYADFDHVERYGSPITGARYRKLDQGPVPNEAFDLLTQMAVWGTITVEQRETGPYVQYRYEARQDPDLSVFGPTEIETLRRVAARWGGESSAASSPPPTPKPHGSPYGWGRRSRTTWRTIGAVSTPTSDNPKPR